MLFHLPIKKVYLNRRSRLFQTYQPLHTLEQFPQNSEQRSDQSNLETKEWLCKLSQVLENKQFNIKQARAIIFSARSQQIYSVSNQLISIIKIMMNFHSASKISNVLYYLCRRSKLFRQKLTAYLNKLSIMLQNKQFGSVSKKISFILTDVFIFGIYFTQNQFVQQILSPIFEEQQDNSILLEQILEFRLHYIHHYIDILSLPYILLQKNYRRLLSFSNSTLVQLSNKTLICSLNHFKHTLQNLQNFYAFQKQTVETQQLSLGISEHQKQFLKALENYEAKRLQILKTISQILNNQGDLGRKENSQFQFESIKKDIEDRFPHILKVGSQEKDQTSRDEGNQKQSSDSGSIESQFQQTLNQKQKAQKKLLLDIYNNCKSFKNVHNYHPSPLYSLQLNLTPVKKILAPSSICYDNPIIFIEQLPDQFLQLLQNCSDIEGSTMLANKFLNQYNKHCNRVKLVYAVMKQFYERNNISYIVRVLAIVRESQTKQIDDLVQEQVQIIRDKTAGKFMRSQYGRYSSVLIQMLKFKLTKPQPYLLNLLSLLTSMPQLTRIQFQQFQEIPLQQPPLTDLLTILQKLDRQIFYQSLASHIIFNQILDAIRYHIKTRMLGYDFEIVNRFNGLVSYLQNVKIEQTSQVKEIITVQFLTVQRNFREVIRDLQNDLKKKSKRNQITKIINIFVNSISSSNYIESYMYADLIYQINNKKLDEAIKQTTISLILQGLNQGNYQGAANWSRFFGELHRYKIISQNQLMVFLEQIILNAWFPTCPAPATKIICSALDTCSKYLKRTQKISEINQTLSFLLEFKCQILKFGGLQNSILEYQVEQILQLIHEGFKYVKSVEQCQNLRKQSSKKNNDLEVSFNKFLKQGKKLEQQIVKSCQLSDPTLQKKTSKPLKYSQKQSEQKVLFKQKTQLDIEGTEISQANKVEITDLQTNSSQYENEVKTNSSSNSNKKENNENESEPKEGKKMKIIGRKRNGEKKIEKIVITI